MYQHPSRGQSVVKLELKRLEKKLLKNPKRIDSHEQNEFSFNSKLNDNLDLKWMHHLYPSLRAISSNQSLSAYALKIAEKMCHELQNTSIDSWTLYFIFAREIYRWFT